MVREAMRKAKLPVPKYAKVIQYGYTFNFIQISAEHI